MTSVDNFENHKSSEQVLDSILTDITALKAANDKVLADITAIRNEVVKLVTDMASRISNHNTLVAKLNLDAGVTDENYAVATAATASNPAALTDTAVTLTTTT